MSEAADTYGIHSSTGYWVQRLARSMNEYFERRLAQHGLTVGLWPILGALGRDGAATPSEVARITGIDPSAVPRQLDRLEKAGLLQRVRSATDRRSVLLELTETGEEFVPKLAALSLETNERFLRGVTEEEVAAFKR